MKRYHGEVHSQGRDKKSSILGQILPRTWLLISKWSVMTGRWP